MGSHVWFPPVRWCSLHQWTIWLGCGRCWLAWELGLGIECGCFTGLPPCWLNWRHLMRLLESLHPHYSPQKGFSLHGSQLHMLLSAQHTAEGIPQPPECRLEPPWGLPWKLTYYIHKCTTTTQCKLYYVCAYSLVCISVTTPPAKVEALFNLRWWCGPLHHSQTSDQSLASAMTHMLSVSAVCSRENIMCTINFQHNPQTWCTRSALKPTAFYISLKTPATLRACQSLMKVP